MKSKKKIIIISVLALAALILSFLLYKIYASNIVKKKYVVELGSSTIDVKDLLNKDVDASIITTVTTEDLNTVNNEFEVKTKAVGKVYSTKVIVKDTTAPTGIVTPQEIYLSQEIKAEAFVTDIQDLTEVNVSYKSDPDFNKTGEQDITIVLKDTSDNATEYNTSLTIKKDTVAPVISGVKNKTVNLDASVSYKKGVTAKDNVDGKVDVTIDTSQVNLSKEGSYTVTYTAVDKVGNKATKTSTITVQKQVVTTASQDDVFNLADQILSKIINNNMSSKEKLRAIYNYVRAHVAYQDGHDKPGYIVAAYNGLVKHRGDCYVYWATSKVLLTRAGISNVDIHNVPEVAGHYWNLVNIGEGWYHFDTCPRKGGFNGFYLSSSSLASYSNSHKNSHKYDPSLYPAIN